MSFGQLPPPGTQPEGSSSRVVLPPVRHLLGELGMLLPEHYERGPVLPQLRLPEEPVVAPVPRMDEEESERTTDTTSTQARGKRGRMEVGGEGEEKRAARKIYVACDFCRGERRRCIWGRMTYELGRTETAMRRGTTAVLQLRDAVAGMQVPGAPATAGAGQGAEGITGEEGGEEERGGSGYGRALGSTIKGNLGGGGLDRYAI
jgi:hypothetical protein